MKTEIKESESMVAQLRKIRDQIGLEIQDMTPEQIVEYFDNKKRLLSKGVWQKQNNSSLKEQ